MSLIVKKTNLMKTIFIILTILITLSCSNSEKSENKDQQSAYELENISLATGIRMDTLYLGVQIGNSNEEFQRQINILLNKNQVGLETDSSVVSILQTQNYKYYVNTKFDFEEGKLFRCVSYLYPEKSEKIGNGEIDMKTDLLITLDSTFKIERKQGGTQNAHSYWLTGNRRTDFYDTLGTYIIVQSDIQTEREIEERIKNKPSEFTIVKSIDIFKERFNSFAQETDFSYRITDIKIIEGEVNNVFTYMFNSNLALNGQVNKSDNSIRSLTMISQGDGSINSGLNMLIVIGAIISATNPEISPEEKGEILKELGLMSEQVPLSNLSSSTIKNDIKYFLNVSDVMGITFGAQSRYEE
jgi:hypothetical protein